MPTGLTKTDLVRDFAALGLVAGDIVLVHSSLSSMGFVEGGPDTVIDAMLDVLGPSGTLLMPSFQSGGEHDLLRRGCVFDLRTSPSELGIITERFRLRSGVIRSINPTHCTAGIGAKADDILKDHQYCNVSVGRNSPYDKCARAGGKILLLGVSHGSNTTLHFVENTSGAPTVCRERFNPLVIDLQGRCWTVPPHPHMPGLLRDYNRVESDLLAAGIQKSGKAGQADAHLVSAQPMVDLIGEKLRHNPLYLIKVFTP